MRLLSEVRLKLPLNWKPYNYTKNGINLYIFIVAFIKNFLYVIKHIDTEKKTNK